MNTTNVFVYGSLKTGFGNHGLFYRCRDNSFLGDATTSDSDFDMFSYGAFPACVRESVEGFKIRGEVYEVGPETLKALDQLEGNGRFYSREQIFVTMDDGSEEEAWIYLILYQVPTSRERVELEGFDTLVWTKSIFSKFK